MSEEPSDWALVGLDPKTARKQGVPAKIPVPTAELESIGDKGMTVDAIRGWVSRFMAQAPVMNNAAWKSENAALVKSFEAFVGKKDAWAKAQAAFAKRDFKAAIGALKMVAAVDPNDHAARLNLASALAAAADHAGALAQIDGVAETFADEADFHVTRGNVLLSLERRDDAIGAFVDALERDGSCGPALETLKGLGVLVAVYEDPKDAASLTYVRSDSVLAHVQGVWDASPRDVAYYFEQIAYHEMERRSEIALAAAERAIALGGDAPHARAVSAKISALLGLGRVGDATALAQSAASGDRPSASALVDLARCFLAADKKAEATAALDRAIEAEPGDLMALDLRWWPAERHDLQLIQDAMPHLQAHAEAHPQAAGAWRTYARAKLAIGDGDTGMALLEKAVGLAPDDDDARAEWWGELIRRGSAASVLADAAKLDMPKRSWKLRWNEAEAYQASGKPMEARASFTAINHDESLPLDVRKRAKRAVTSAKG